PRASRVTVTAATPGDAPQRPPPRLPVGRRMDRSRIPHQRRCYGDGGSPRRAYDRQETYCPSPFLGKNSTSKKNRTLALGRFKVSWDSQRIQWEDWLVGLGESNCGQ